MMSPWLTPQATDETSFSWVYANKRSSTTGRYHTFRGQNQTVPYQKDERSGRLYTPDSVDIVAAKCFLIAVTNPIHVSIKLGIKVSYIPYDIIRHAFLAISECFADRGEDSIFRLATRVVLEIGSDTLQNIIEAVKTPFYAIGLELAALRGLTSFLIFGDELACFDARVQIAEIEYNANEGRGRSQDFRFYFQPGHEADLRVSYLGLCLQSQGHVDDTIPSGERKFEVIRSFSSRNELIQHIPNNPDPFH